MHIETHESLHSIKRNETFGLKNLEKWCVLYRNNYRIFKLKIRFFLLFKDPLMINDNALPALFQPCFMHEAIPKLLTRQANTQLHCLNLRIDVRFNSKRVSGLGIDWEMLLMLLGCNLIIHNATVALGPLGNLRGYLTL